MKTDVCFVFAPGKCVVRYQGKTLAEIIPAPDADQTQFAILCCSLALYAEIPLIRQHDETKP